MRVEQWQQVMVVLQHGYGKRYLILITINTGKCANMSLPIGGDKSILLFVSDQKDGRIP